MLYEVITEATTAEEEHDLRALIRAGGGPISDRNVNRLSGDVAVLIRPFFAKNVRALEYAR